MGFVKWMTKRMMVKHDVYLCSMCDDRMATMPYVLCKKCYPHFEEYMNEESQRNLLEASQ